MDAAKATLTKRWESLTHPPLIQLSEFLLSWDVAYVSDYGLIELRHPDAGEAGDGDLSYTFYVHPRGDQVKIKEMLSQFHQDPESCFAEFMLHFAGLGEATGECWRFVDEKEPWLTLKDAYGEDFEGPDRIWEPDSENKRDYDVWKDAFRFYTAGNGDVLLMHPDGRIAWWVMGEAIAQPVADSFEEFVLMYIEFRSKGFIPDSDEGPLEIDEDE